ncbi:PIG-L deacetylase family protein [Pseudomonas rhodesiae]|uniref:PIG-L deacetylase family protein n=1 Tax=Pseudomonas rhodesiae TaxID=76760 RepID=UPI00209FFE7B|nr:PIG-L family deacetylase [Pseudomonas rhodesiae]MCP1511292.1 LmbE family N-acetylglucosaminyl deacetylase [Pseudomonas rhodesiae]MDF9770114.1 LmbE family N-acetylglucosaminyl deacetylase [Pseudomonas rhodesiae]
MKPASLSEGRRGPAQIWNSAPQLAQIPLVAPTALVPSGARVVVVAPHPGDEVLACGGLLQLFSQLEHPLQLISITDGSASHPGSLVWPASRLSVVRPQESAEALRRLGMPLHSLKWIRGGFCDNALAGREPQLSQFIARYLHPGDVVFTTWCNDGNRDHDAVGRATATACDLIGARLYELPVWAWHGPVRQAATVPWPRARKVRLDTWSVARKLHAVHAYASQLAGDPEIGLAPILAHVLLERMREPYEIVLI